MKRCPKCKRTYHDDTLSFCLDDGSLLSAPSDTQATVELPAPDISVVTRQASFVPRPTEPAPTVASAVETVRETAPDVIPVSTGRATQTPEAAGPKWGRQALLVILGIVIGVTGVGIVLFAVSRPGPDGMPTSSVRDETGNANRQASVSTGPTPADAATSGGPKTPAAATPTNAPSRTPTPTHERTVTSEKAVFSPMLNNVSFNGDNLTYYRGSTAAQCKADCARNPRCAGFTYIKPEGYNPGDPAMCYLAARITSQAPHKCCISAKKVN